MYLPRLTATIFTLGLLANTGVLSAFIPGYAGNYEPIDSDPSGFGPIASEGSDSLTHTGTGVIPSSTTIAVKPSGSTSGASTLYRQYGTVMAWSTIAMSTTALLLL